jgi:hypothetical protein
MKRLIFAILVFVMTCADSAFGQQTIFNVPSADVMDKGKVYGELDVSFKTNCQEALCRFSSFVPRVVVGAIKNVEVGLNITGNVQPGADTTTIVPTVKWRFYHDEKGHVDLYGGNNFYIPVRNKSYDFGTYTYVAIAKTIKKTRLTAGGYVASKGVFAPGATRGGGQFGFEQAVTKNFNLIADWITGQHSAGYFTPGISFKPGPKWTGYVGYSIGNSNAANGNHFFLMELGYNFN